MRQQTLLSGNYRLTNLQKWLSFELPGIVLFGISFFYYIALTVLQIAVLLFTPYLLYVLFMEKKYGWLAAFAIVVLLPAVVVYYWFGPPVITGDPLLAGGQIIAGYLPLAFFLAYCYVLKLSIPGMLDE